MILIKGAVSWIYVTLRLNMALPQNCHSEERSDEESAAGLLSVSPAHHPRPLAALGVTC